MGELSPVIEGHVKFRDGKKVRFIDIIPFHYQNICFIRECQAIISLIILMYFQWKARFARVIRLSPVAGTF